MATFFFSSPLFPFFFFLLCLVLSVQKQKRKKKEKKGKKKVCELPEKLVSLTKKRSSPAYSSILVGLSPPSDNFDEIKWFTHARTQCRYSKYIVKPPLRMSYLMMNLVSNGRENLCPFWTLNFGCNPKETIIIQAPISESSYARWPYLTSSFFLRCKRECKTALNNEGWGLLCRRAAECPTIIIEKIGWVFWTRVSCDMICCQLQTQFCFFLPGTVLHVTPGNKGRCIHWVDS